MSKQSLKLFILITCFGLSGIIVASNRFDEFKFVRKVCPEGTVFRLLTTSFFGFYAEYREYLNDVKQFLRDDDDRHYANDDEAGIDFDLYNQDLEQNDEHGANQNNGYLFHGHP